MPVESHKLRFNLNKPSEQKAWEIVQTVASGKRNRFILDAILAFKQQQTEEEQQEQLAEMIANKVAERLSDISIPMTIPSSNNPTELDADVMEQNLANAEDFLSHWC